MQILLIGNTSNLMTELYNDLSQYFKVTFIGFDKDEIYQQLNQLSVDLILVNLKEASKEQLLLVDLLKLTPQWKDLKIMVIGFGYECNVFKKYIHVAVDKIVTYPIPKEDIMKEINTLCGMDNGLKEQNENIKMQRGEEALKHVLVIDDDARMLRAVKNWFQDIYKVTIVNSADAAMTFLEKQIPDVILLDYEMPVCNGPQTLELIRKEERLKEIPVFFLTGVSDKEKVRNAVILNPQGYILKGITREEMIVKLNNFFAVSI